MKSPMLVKEKTMVVMTMKMRMDQMSIVLWVSTSGQKPLLKLSRWEMKTLLSCLSKGFLCIPEWCDHTRLDDCRTSAFQKKQIARLASYPREYSKS